MSKIFLCLDPGGSQTKIIYQLPSSEKPQYLLMKPDVEEIKGDSLTRYKDKESSMSNPAPDRQAYLEVNKQTFVVGHFASLFDPEDRLKEVKYENAIYKVLAAVGVVAEQNKFAKKKISLHLGILLPWDEYGDRRRMYDKLSQYLQNFSFRDKSYSVKLDKFICRPEGGGLVAIHTKKKGTQWQQEKKLGVLMCGHRNITALNFEYGELRGDSPLIGFANFLDDVIERTSGLDRNRLASAIFKALESKEALKEYNNEKYARQNFYPCWGEQEAVTRLANARDKELRHDEVQDIGRAIITAREDYWEKVSKWLTLALSPDLDAVIISGGASRFLKPSLERYFNCEHCYEKKYSYGSIYVRIGEYEKLDSKKHFTPIVWGADFTSSIAEILNLNGKKERESSLSYRLVDAYGLFDLLIAKNQKKVQKISPGDTQQETIAS